MAEWERERARLDLDELGDLPWNAVLTDGRVWWAWQWEILSDGELSPPREIVSGERYSPKSAAALAGLAQNRNLLAYARQALGAP